MPANPGPAQDADQTATSTAVPAQPTFEYHSPTTQFRTHGNKGWLAPWWHSDDLARSLTALTKQAQGKFLVGALPFDTTQPPALFEPESIEELHAPPAPGVGHAGVVEDEDSNEERAQNFKQRTASALAALNAPANPLEKIVLARLASWHTNSYQDFDAHDVFAQLCTQNPGTYRFKFTGIPQRYEVVNTATATTGPAAPPATLTGASPELVLAVQGQELHTHPLAGSLPAAVAQALAADGDQAVLDALYTPKNRAEHAHVTRDIATTLQRFCSFLEVPDTPDIVRTPTVWHLGTHIHGEVAPDTNLLELLYALHPTPAVSGFPQQAAREFLAQRGVFDRGLFSGVIGWLDQRPGKPVRCEWAMTLRCGIIQGPTAVAFAGAGIVSGSDPEEERQETTAKLTTFARAL
ncbi:MAG: chorismate-binding protein [Corynebacterium sp.]|nr:chorismate-binding protein [Corynebacterium sp.]